MTDAMTHADEEALLGRPVGLCTTLAEREAFAGTRCLVTGAGGSIGSELAQAFARLGSKVTQVEMLPRLLMREDPEISGMVMAQFAAEGVEVRVNHKAKEFRVENGRKLLVCEHQGREVRIEFDEVRVPYLKRYRPEVLELTGQRWVPVLVHGEEVIHDSKRIVEYLDHAERTGAPTRSAS